MIKQLIMMGCFIAAAMANAAPAKIELADGIKPRAVQF